MTYLIINFIQILIKFHLLIMIETQLNLYMFFFGRECNNIGSSDNNGYAKK